MDEDDIRIGGIAHFSAAHPSERDDRVGTERAFHSQFLACRRNCRTQGGFDGDVRGAGYGCPRRNGVDRSKHLPHGDAQKLAPSEIAACAGDFLRVEPA